MPPNQSGWQQEPHAFDVMASQTNGAKHHAVMLVSAANGHCVPSQSLTTNVYLWLVFCCFCQVCMGIQQRS